MLFAKYIFAFSPIVSTVLFAVSTTALFYSILYMQQWSVLYIFLRIACFFKSIKRDPDYVKMLSIGTKITAEKIGVINDDGWKYILWVKKYWFFLGLKIFRWEQGASYHKLPLHSIPYLDIEKELMDDFLASQQTPPQKPKQEEFDPFV
jgi:hypothetical protein